MTVKEQKDAAREFTKSLKASMDKNDERIAELEKEQRKDYNMIILWSIAGVILATALFCYWR